MSLSPKLVRKAFWLAAVACGCGGADEGPGSTEGGGTSAATGGDGANSGDGGAGSSTECEPGSTLPCYPGDPVTEGVGPCHPGTQTCDPDGTGYGACAGAIVPVDETCASPADDDCDGLVDEEGVDCTCTPGAEQPCYSGPAGTSGVGLCVSGVQQCLSTGVGYGACQGEVAPAIEYCGTSVDENCDGDPYCGGIEKVLMGIGDAPNSGKAQAGLGVACQATHCAAGGVYKGAIAVGASTLTSVGNDDAWLFGLTAGGAASWAKSWGTSGNDAVRAIAPSASGGFIVLGDFETASVALGDACSTVTGPTESNLLVFEIDPLGACVWAKAFGSSGDVEGAAVAVSSGGQIAITGGFTGTLTLGGDSLTSSGTDMFVAVLSDTGDVTWAKKVGGASSQVGTEVGFDASGDLVAAGNVQGTAEFASTTWPSGGGVDALVLRLSSAGSLVWGKRYGGTGDQVVSGLAVKDTGDFFLVGSFEGTLNFDSDPLGALENEPGTARDAYVSELSAEGDELFSDWYESDGGWVEPSGLSMDDAEQVYWVGSFTGEADVVYDAPIAGTEGFVLKLSSDEEFWSLALLGQGSQEPFAVAATGTGIAVVVGQFAGSMTVGSQSLDAKSLTDGFLLMAGP